MIKKIFTIIVTLLFILFTAFILLNKDFANQIVISAEDVYDKVTGDYEIPEDVSEIKINELQPENSTFYYNLLNENQKNIYKAVAIAVKNLNKKAKVKEYNYIDDNNIMTDAKKAMENFFLDHPEVFYVNNEYTVSTIDLVSSKRIEIEINYNISDEIELNKKIAEINSILNPIISEAKTMDKFDAELYLHDQICKIATYYKYTDINQVPDECHSIYGCLVSHKAVCDGLSKTLMIALDKVGIKNIVITGNIKDQAHEWNMVNLDDEWYHVDITSNKSVKNETNNSEEIIHSYFNITTEQIKSSNTIDKEENLPHANSDKYNYYIKKGKYITSGENFVSKLKKILDENENDNLIEFAVDSKVNSVPDKMVYVFQDDEYEKYVDKNASRFNYYNVLNTYILLANK